MIVPLGVTGLLVFVILLAAVRAASPVLAAAGLAVVGGFGLGFVLAGAAQAVRL